MNSREATDYLFRGKSIKRVGVYDSPWPDTIEKWTQQGRISKNKDIAFISSMLLRSIVSMQLIKHW